MSAQEIADMFDDLDSTRVKLRLRSRRLWSTVATRKEEGPGVRAAADGLTPDSVGLPPSTPDDDDGPVPLGGYP